MTFFLIFALTSDNLVKNAFPLPWICHYLRLWFTPLIFCHKELVPFDDRIRCLWFQAPKNTAKRQRTFRRSSKPRTSRRRRKSTAIWRARRTPITFNSYSTPLPTLLSRTIYVVVDCTENAPVVYTNSPLSPLFTDRISTCVKFCYLGIFYSFSIHYTIRNVFRRPALLAPGPSYVSCICARQVCLCNCVCVCVYVNLYDIMYYCTFVK